MKKNKYKLITDFSLLPEKVKQHFNTKIGEDFAERKFNGILKGKELIAFISYSQKKDSLPKLVQIWMDLKEGVYYRRQENISPLEAIYNKMYDSRIQCLESTGLTPAGKQMLDRYTKKKILEIAGKQIILKKRVPNRKTARKPKPMH